MPFLTVITVVHDNFKGLLSIYEHLNIFLNEDIRWIIKDSGSCKKTEIWSSKVDNPNIRFILSKDKGIYNALNIAIRETKSDFYLVVGSDDYVFHAALNHLKNAYYKNQFSNLDIITFPIIVKNKIYFPKRYRPSSFSISSIITSHSVGTIIRTSIHHELGFYDESYKILADSYFIRIAQLKKYRFKLINHPTIGVFSTHGISNTEYLLKAKEAFKYNRMCRSPIPLQAFYYLIRLLVIFYKYAKK
jgi:glycosyltransferase involved in cell wall biosynthesis